MLGFSTLLATPAIPPPICDPPVVMLGVAESDPGKGLGRVSRLRMRSAAWAPPGWLGSAPGWPNGVGVPGDPGCCAPSGVIAPDCAADGLNGLAGTPGKP